jgi:quinol monooxygenase YgiN
VFPPPRPWKQIGEVDPDKEYVAFTSRFFLKSVRHVPAFVAQSQRIVKRVSDAPGIVGWSLGTKLASLEFYTLSAWEDESSLRGFVGSEHHLDAMKKFAADLRAKSIFVRFPVLGKDLPLKWKDVVARQDRQRDSEQ